MPTAIYDAIIVGSGITGGWAAKELTEKGLNTLVLEAGRTIVPERDYVEHVPVWELRHRDWDDRFVRERTQPIQRECYYEIGRASCRERKEIIGDVESEKHKYADAVTQQHYRAGGSAK